MPHIGEKSEYPMGRGMPRTVTPTGSGYVFIAPCNGMIVMSGGTISLIEYGRVNTFIGAGFTSGPVFMASGDKLRVSYLLPPTITFFPM